MARGKRGGAAGPHLPPGLWLDEARISGHGVADLGCDSLEALWISSAACEMFDLAEAGRHHALAASDRFGEWLDIIEGAWHGGLGTVTFTTSGTTGRPKRCTHELVDLQAEARHFTGVFGDCRRVLAFVPAHHIYGFLFTALLPDALDAECLDIAEATEALAASRPGDLLVAFPERWSWIERVVRHFGADVLGVTSTAPCPRDLVEALIGAGLGGMTEVYGSSETAGIATRCWPQTTYRLLPRWSFAEADGRACLVDAAGRCAALPDMIERTGAEAFVPAGRVDDAVQVGGTNVHPEAVAVALRERPGVAEAAVRLMRPEEGSRLKAFIVADGSVAQDLLRAALVGWLAQTMEAPARPVDFRFGTRLPRNALGKLSDW